MILYSPPPEEAPINSGAMPYNIVVKCILLRILTYYNLTKIYKYINM